MDDLVGLILFITLMQGTALKKILMISSSTITKLLTHRFNPLLVQDFGCISELHNLILGIFKFLSRVHVSWHCLKLDMLINLDQIVDCIENILPIGKSPQVISLGPKVLDILNLSLNIYEELNLIFEFLR